MKRIPLTQGKFALVDDEEFARLSQWKWHYGAKGYAVRWVTIGGKKSMRLMHHEVAGRKPGLDSDHVNRDRLDNRKKNLRFVSRSMNCHNRTAGTGNAESGYRGVRFYRSFKSAKKWGAGIKFCGRRVHLGLFTTSEEAARAYDRAARKVFGPSALVNFPRRS